jgi:uncharacterized protein YjeT (DUF2065 family)
MTTLACWSIAVGFVHLVLSAPLLIQPSGALKVLKAFPRHEWAGRVLAAVCIAWSVVLVREMPLGWFDAYKVWLYVAGPLLYLLITLFMAKLLAARALGGVLLLVASPVLDAARFQPSGLRLIVVVLAYGWVIAGMALVLAPYRFRRAAQALCDTTIRCRITGGLGVALGVVLIGLGLSIF